MSQGIKHFRKFDFSGIKFICFLAIELIIIVGGTIYLTIISENMTLALIVLVFSFLIAIVITMLGLFLTTITRINLSYIVIHIALAYPVIRAWLDMIQEEDWLQVLVDFLVLSPMLGGLLLSLPLILVFRKKTAAKQTVSKIEEIDN